MKQSTTSIINDILIEKIHSTMETIKAPKEVKISIYDNSKQIIEHLKTKKKFKTETISTNNFNVNTYGIDFEGSEIITDDISNLQFDENIEDRLRKQF